MRDLGALPGRTTRVTGYGNADLHPADGLLVKAPAPARWTLTPFDALPVATVPVSGRRTAVVGVRTGGSSTLRCDGALLAKNFYRPAGSEEYEVGTVVEQDPAGYSTLHPPRGTDLLVSVLVCADRWALTPGRAPLPGVAPGGRPVRAP